MIAMPLYNTVIDGIVNALTAVAEEEAAWAYFEVSKNRSRPYIESVTNKALVNIVLDSIETDSARSSLQNKMHKATYFIDMYVKGNTGEVLEPADEVATDRLHLLTAQVEYALTHKSNNRFGLAIGQVENRSEITLKFYSLQDENSAAVYAPARWTMILYFPYAPAEATPEALEQLNVNVQKWQQRYIYTS